MEDLAKVAEKAGALFQIGVVATGIAVVTGGAVAAQDLGEFPNQFINDDGEVDTVVVVGDEAKNMDTVGAINIVASLTDAASEHSTETVEGATPGQSVDDVALYSASNVDEEIMEKDMILVGGPQVNQLTQNLSEKGEVPGEGEIAEDEAVIKLVEDAFNEDQDALIVAGYSSEATMDAANFLAEYHENEERLDGETKIRIDTSEKGTEEFQSMVEE